jgi:excisionase family DNA binding protein
MRSKSESLPVIHSYLTSKEVCELLRISAKTLQRMRQNRKITYVRVCGRGLIFPQTEVERFLKERTVLAA